MTWPEYLELVEWTGRQYRADKRGAIPADLPPILDLLQLTAEGWQKLLSGFRKEFHRAAGRPESLSREAVTRGRQWLKGIATSRAAFA